MTTDTFQPDYPASVAGQDAFTFAAAREAFDNRMWADAARGFAQLLESGSYGADASYGLGMVELELGSTARARDFFEQAVARAPEHANAWYQLGRLAEAGSAGHAIEYYRHALEGDPSHYGATQRLQMLDVSSHGPGPRVDDRSRRGAPSRPDDHTTAPEPGVATQLPLWQPGQLGIEQMLRADQSDISRQAVALIDSLRVTTRLHFSAQLQKLTRRLVLMVGVPAAAAFVLYHVTPIQVGGTTVHFYQGDITGVILAAAVIWLITVAISFLRCVTSVVTIANARMRIERGILHRWIETVDLWILNDIDLDRDFIQRLTGDGTITFKGTRHERQHRWSRGKSTKPFSVTGLERGSELDRIYRQLLDLKFLLRANPIVKGIIQ